MTATIILHQGDRFEILENLLKKVRQALPSNDITLVTSANFKPSDEAIRCLTGENTFPLAQALEEISSSHILLLDSRLLIIEKQINRIKEILSKETTSVFAGSCIKHGDSIVEWPEGVPEKLPHLLAYQDNLPLACAIIDKRLLLKVAQHQISSLAEILLYSFIYATAEAETVLPADIDLSDLCSDLPQECLSPGNGCRAAALELAVNLCDLESLFPEHAWAQHQEESAAACYHAIAALFIRLGAVEQALECLELSDQFEDSPRSLALKGLIALRRGETLAAVANMVSSLQHYEIRKRENDRHYTRFLPNNVEVINRKLNLGLTALNHRDNSTAAQHFADAVFSFDAFYGEHGINRGGRIC